MKKKLLIFTGIALWACTLTGQNLQVHYDSGKDRKHVTTTLEMFKPDAWGSTFFFVDFDYNSNDVKGVSLAYMEIARAIKFWENPLAFQVEYNGGFGQFWTPEANIAYQLNDAWLSGGQYTWNNADYTRIFTLQLLYKNIRAKHDLSFQLTGVWNMQWMDRKITFMGFADFWREDNTFADSSFESDFTTTKYVFLAEPQLWYNFNPRFSAGSEVEVSSNFAGNQGFMINPTLALKWTF